MSVVLIVIGFFALCFLYYFIKEKAKRNIFFKEQYEEQQSYTHKDTIIVANAPLQAVRAGVVARFPVNSSFSATIVGGNYELLTDTPTCLEYKRWAKFTTNGGGDEFQVRIDFKDEGAARTRIKATTTAWREHDGVTRRKGIEAMREFYDELFAAVRSVDPYTEWNRSGATPKYREDLLVANPSPALTQTTGTVREAAAMASAKPQAAAPARVNRAATPVAGLTATNPAANQGRPQAAPDRGVRPAGPANAPVATAATPKFCPHCGAPLPSGTSFCGKCGTPVRTRSPQPQTQSR